MGNPTNTQDWVRVEVLILRKACTVLRREFKKRWNVTFPNQKWDDGPQSGKLFTSSEGGLGHDIHKQCGRLHKMTLEEGDTNNWDFALLTRILQNVKFPKNEDEQDKGIEELISFSKKAIEHPTKSIRDEDFLKLWNQIERILVSFGESEKELEQLKRSESVSEEEIITVTTEKGESIPSTEEIKTLLNEVKTQREEARSSISCGDLETALDTLNEAIGKIHKIRKNSNNNNSDIETGALHATRSDVYLKKSQAISSKDERMNMAYLALKDAKQALFLRPAWGLAYYRVGMAYVELGKYKKASRYLDLALDLEPNMEEIKVANNSCKIKLVELADDFAPGLKTFQHVSFLPKPRPLPGGTRLSPGVMDRIDSIFFNEDEDNILGDIYKAHKLRDGVDTKQDFKEAASLYRKGVKGRNAEAMYNLALLKLEGKGVRQDVKGAIDLLKRSAKQPIKLCKGNGLSYVSNVGVVESSFLLGLLSSEGIAVPPQKDFFSASVYYQEAADHGHGPAAHNLSLLYQKGLGVAKNPKRALQLWKLGASRKIPESMWALAIHHAKEWETAEAHKWIELTLHEFDMNDYYSDDEGENGDEDRSLLFESWKPSHKLIEEFTAVVNTIEAWRLTYGQREMARWETSNGHKNAKENLTMRQRMTRMLGEIEEEKAKVYAIEEYFKVLTPQPVVIPFTNAKLWADNLRRGILQNGGGSYYGGSSRGSSSSRATSQTRSVSSTGSYSDEAYAHLYPTIPPTGSVAG